MNSNKVISVAGGIVVGPHAKIVIVSQTDSWSLPKGHVEVGESIEETAIREVYEETGLSDVKLVGFIGDYERFQIAIGGIGEDTRSLRKISLFLFTTYSENLKPLDPANPEARWVDYNQAVSMLTHPKDAEFLESVRDKVFSFLAQ